MCDKFYTKPQVAEKCISTLRSILPNIHDYTWIEPSAGDGKFLDAMPCPVTGYDIAPDRSDIIEQDFLEFHPTVTSPIGIIGNPPYGSRSKLAIKFINHAALFADVIAFVLPVTFLRLNIQNKLDRRLHLLESVLLPSGSFIPRTTCRSVFQIWKKDIPNRPLHPLPRDTADYTFVRRKIENIHNPSMVWFKASCKSYGRVVNPDEIDIKKMFMYFCIKPHPGKLEQVVTNLQLLESEFVKYGKYSINIPGISQQSLSLIYTQIAR
jgi:hypothetical protein